MRIRNLVAATIAALAFVACSTATADTPSPRDISRMPAMLSAEHETAVGALVTAWNVAAWNAEIGRQWLAAQAEIDAAAAAHARTTPVATPVATGAGGGGCSGLGFSNVSDATLWRESRCQPGAVNETGCYDRGVTWKCYGAAQISGMHYAAGGNCAGLDPFADQVACASRLPSSAWG